MTLMQHSMLSLLFVTQERTLIHLFSPSHPLNLFLRAHPSQWNEANKIRFFRVSSEMFPFASHKTHGYSLAYARAELKVSCPSHSPPFLALAGSRTATRRCRRRAISRGATATG